ncbi:MAG: DUF2723 domain-containing protein [Ignavibacteriae bacterium]|nr:DUF2723 domain-containing protein [Ignavibacteriota bacterium]
MQTVEISTKNKPVIASVFQRSNLVFLLSENGIAVLLILIVLFVYSTTMSPTVSFVDAGELAAVAVTLGIAHPTGYPLFTLLGRCAAMIPLGAEEIIRLNFLSALLTAVTVGLFFKTSLLLFRLRLFSSEDRASKNSTGHFLAAAVGSLVLAFSSTFWSQSTVVEVYSLHIVFLVAATYCFLRGVDAQRYEGGTISRYLVLFAFVLGLGFTNHMTMLLLAPAFLYLYFSVLGWQRESLFRLLRLTPFFLLGLSAYLYLPIRSSVGPSLDWGHAADLERFLWHVSGKQYRSWMFSSFESAEKQFQFFVNTFPAEFHYGVFAFILIGILAAVNRNGRLFVFLILAFLGCLLYAINYDIHDIESYFLLAYLAIAWFCVLGVNAVHRWISKKFPERLGWTLLVLLLLPAVQWWSNNERVDQSENYLVQDYTHSILKSVEPNAFILTYQWDYFFSASYYYQYVRQMRPDVVIIDKELLRRSWYFIMLERNHPWLIERSRDKVNAFLAELYKFEHGLPLNPEVIEERFNDMINDFIDKAMEERPVYVGNEIEPQFAYAYQRMPEGLLFRLVREGESVSLKPLSLTYRPTPFSNDYTLGIRYLYARMLTMNAALMIEQQQLANADSTLDRALEIDAAFLPALQLREELRTRQRVPQLK